MKKTKIGLMFGGKSGEHEVSLRSAESIRNNLDKEKYEVVDIFVGKDGSFDIEKVKSVDVIFPIIHGTYGEDGCLQGMLEMLDLAYVGPGVLGSAVGMDKDVQKRLLSQAGIEVAKHRVGEIGDLKYPVYVKAANMGSSVGVYKVSSIKYLVSSI
ncbi:MAG: D-alanine--D-alanine ligase A, partial [Patescibacteria group bacterium]